jgi:formamidopyrimidine-DNA glycosylase
MEGPQVKALADRLGELTLGRKVDRIDVPADRWQANVLLKHCAGRHINAIRSLGQWLIWDFSHGISWVCYPLRQWRWSLESLQHNPADFQPLVPRAGKRPLLKLSFPHGAVLTLSGRPIFLVLMTDAVARHPSLRELGPDIFDPALTISQWALRVRAAKPRNISHALMNPSIACGIGNELKCETLFTAHLHPSTAISSLQMADLERCLQTVRELADAAYRRALGHPFPLHDQPRVYDRAGEPCDNCGTPIAVDHSGRDGHWSWFCPTCQAPPEEPNLFGKLPFSQRGFQLERSVRSSAPSV